MTHVLETIGLCPNLKDKKKKIGDNFWEAVIEEGKVQRAIVCNVSVLIWSSNLFKYTL